MKDFKTFAQENKVRIPLIQRDYVQGSDTNAAKRDKFLEALLSALETGTPLSLDFIYGSTNSGYFEPLDGQQRITTLFLLYYALKNLSHVQPTKELDEQIRTFTYTTRNSSTAFCQKLFGTEMPWRYTKVFDEEEKKEWSQDIINQPWFCEEWLLDPTIKAMLDMLDSINKRLHAEEYMEPYYGGKAINKVNGESVLEDYSFKWDTMAENLYGNGTSCILFECLNMGEYNLDDSLYIKMNARGKQLTDFENWKAEFIKYLDTKWKDETYKGISVRTYFEQHIEHEWADMLWAYAVERMDNDNEDYPQTDDLFMNLYEYLLSMIFFVKNPTIKGRDVKTEDFNKSKAEFLLSMEKEDLDFLFAALDCFAAIDNQQSFFGNLFYLQDEDSNRKVRLFDKLPNTDLFGLCICKDKAFTAKMQVLLYCIVRYGIQYGVDVTEELVQYTRVCRNLIESIVQREDGATIRSNVRLADMAKYKIVINQLIADKDVCKSLENIDDNTTGFGNIAHEKEKANWAADIEAIEDFDFVRGHLQAFDKQQLSDHPDKMYEALHEFEIADKNKEKDIIRLLISYGFTGVGCGWCRLGMRYFFGKCGKWNTLFYVGGKDNQTFPTALNTYIDGYCNGKDINRQLNDIHIPDETADAFNYYVLKYPASHREWDKDCNYVSIAQNDHNSYGYVELNNYSFNPLLSYYSDIFSKAAYNELTKQNVDKNRVKIHPARYSNNDPKLSLDKTWKLVCRKDGWHITQEEANTAVMPADLIKKYQITEESTPKNTSYMLLPKIEGKDLVETAVAFVSDYLKLVNA